MRVDGQIRFEYEYVWTWKFFEFGKIHICVGGVLNEAIDVYDFMTYMFYCRSKSLEYLNSLKFQFMKSRKLSDLCSKFTNNR